MQRSPYFDLYVVLAITGTALVLTLAGIESILLRVLFLVPLVLFVLFRQFKVSRAEVQGARLEHEPQGRLERHPGNRVSLTAS